MKNTQSNNTQTESTRQFGVNKIDINVGMLTNMTGRQTFELTRYISESLLFNESFHGQQTFTTVSSMKFGSMDSHCEKMVREIYLVSVYNYETGMSQKHDVEFFRAIDWSCVNISSRKI